MIDHGSAMRRVLAALGEGTARRTSSGYAARCPAHEDRVASLSITAADDVSRDGVPCGRVKLHCHAGCSYGDVLSRLRLTPSELWDDHDAARTGRVYRAAVVAAVAAVPKEKPAGLTVRPLDGDHAASVAAARGRLGALADEIGVPIASMEALGVGYGGSCWTMPMRDGAGTLVGWSDRHADGSKKTRWATRNGLFYAPGQWNQGDGPLLIVEGASDTLACHGIGLAVVGRPSATGGVAMLVDLLQAWPADRAIVVVGEHDAKPGGRWPGRDGAVAVAGRLAEELDRPILWSLPPDGHKDARAWIAAGIDAAAITAQILAVATAVQPPPGAIHEDGTLPKEDPRMIREYRHELFHSKTTAMGEQGVFVDTSPTGAGKSYSTCVALRDVPGVLVETVDKRGRVREREVPLKSVTALPTHENCRERAAEMRAVGILAKHIGIMPELTRDNCQNFEAATAAREAGLSHGQVVCRRCPYSKGCPYAADTARATNRGHLLLTHERLRRSAAAKYITGRQIVIIDERPNEVIRPAIECNVNDLEEAGEFFAVVAASCESVALQTLDSWADGRGAPDRAVAISAAAARLHRAAVDLATQANAITEPGAYMVESADVEAMPARWEQLVPDMLAESSRKPPAGAVRLLLALGEGLATAAAVVVDRRPDGEFDRKLLIAWAVPFEGQSLHLLDGTADAATLERLAGRPVTDITPQGHLAAVHDVRQRPIDVTKGRSVSRVRGILMAVMDEMPGDAPVGLIGHQIHVRALLGLPAGAPGAGEVPAEPVGDPEIMLPERYRRRVAMATWFGQGLDRASNEWHSRCPGGLIVLGTPRVPSVAVRVKLLAEGDIEAANRPGQWGPYEWDATTVDGQTTRITGRGYHDPAWRAAHTGIVRAAARQAVGRARASLPEGVPVVVLSTEPLGLPVDCSDLRVLSDTATHIRETAREITELARAAVAANLPSFLVQTRSQEPVESIRHTLTPPIRRQEKHLYTRRQGVADSFSPVAIGVAALAAVSGIDLGSGQEGVHERRDLVEAGVLHSPRLAFWALGPAPAAGTAYIVVSDVEDDRSFELAPQAAVPRPAATAARVAELAAQNPGGVVTTDAFAEAAIRRTAERRLNEAVEAGEVVRVDHGAYAPAGVDATHVPRGGRRLVAIRHRRDARGRREAVRLEVRVVGRNPEPGLVRFPRRGAK
jgi:hypothetical protein